MRVGLVVYGSLEALSGGYLYDRKLVGHLRRAGDEVEIVSIPWRDYARHLADNLSPGLFRRLARLQVDVLLQDELNHPSLFSLNRRLRRHVDFPMVAIVHHLRSSEWRPAWANWLYRQVERRYLQTLDGFVFNSRTTRTVVEGLLGGERASVVAYPGGDRLKARLTAAEVAARARQPGPLRVLFLGNLIPRKGLHTLLEAVDKLPPQAWELRVVGGGPNSGAAGPPVFHSYVRRLRRTASDPIWASRVRFLGPLEDRALVEQLEESHLLAVPSSYEGFGIAYLEAMGFGLPAIASTAGAAHEILTHGQDGFLIEPGDVEALARHLITLHQDRERLLKMGLAAMQRFKGHPTWQDSAERVRGFLCGLI